MKHSATAALALILAAAFGGAAAAQSMATPGPTPNSWTNAVPGPVGPSSRTAARHYYYGYGPEAYYPPGYGYGSSTPPVVTAPLTSPGNPQAPLGAGGMTTGGEMLAR